MKLKLVISSIIIGAPAEPVNRHCWTDILPIPKIPWNTLSKVANPNCPKPFTVNWLGEAEPDSNQIPIPEVRKLLGRLRLGVMLLLAQAVDFALFLASCYTNVRYAAGMVAMAKAIAIPSRIRTGCVSVSPVYVNATTSAVLSIAACNNTILYCVQPADSSTFSRM